jgi:tetratricopeptide (TPR) repeat protein
MFRRLLLLAAVFLLVAGVSSAFADSRDVFEDAERRFSAGNYSLAIERYERLLADYPGSEFTSRAHFRIGQSRYYLQDYPAALDRLQRAAARTPGGAVARQIQLWIGLTSFQLERFPEAILAFNRYLAGEAVPQGRAFLYRGLSRLETGDVPGARQDLESALPLLEGAERGFAAAVSMELYARENLDEEVLRVWEETEGDLDPGDGYHEQRLRFAADAAYARGETQLARSLYSEMVDFSLGSAQWGYQRLYSIARDEGDSEEMRILYRRAEQRLAVEPQRMSDFWLALGVEAISAGRYELAELHLFRVWEVRDDRPVSGVVPRLLARAFERQGRPAEALDVLLQSLEDPNVGEQATVERRIAAARILLALERPDEAVDVMSVLPERTVESTALYAWTFALYRSGRSDEALHALNRNDLQPVVREQPDLVRLRARLLLEDDRSGEAVRVYRDYLADRPDDTEARLELLRALVGASQFSAAMQEAARISEGDLSPGRLQELAYLRGLTAFHNEQFAQAEALLNTVTDPGYEPLRSYHLAWARYRQGSTGPARDAIASVMEDLPTELLFEGGYLYGWTLFQSGENQGSIRQLLRLLGVALPRERELQVRQLLATVYLADRDVNQALVQYRRLIELADRDWQRADLWSQYASTLAGVGQVDNAVDQYDELHGQLPDTESGRRAVLDAGQLLVSQERFREARERFRLYQNRYSSGPELDRALYWAGATSLEMEEAARALLWWEPLVLEFPRSVYTPRALIGTAEIYAQRGQQRQSLELYDRFVAAYPNDPRAAEADRERRRIRLELDGLSGREAELWVELEPAGRDGPAPGGDRWFDLVLELGRIAIREQIALTTQRNRIVEYLIEGAGYEGNNAAQAAVLLAEYYRRRGETRAALEQYVRAASAEGVSDELAAQSLYELAVLSREQGERETTQRAVAELMERFRDSVWADRAERLMEQN